MDPARVAIVHDFLSQHGGAERVVLRFAGLFPDAPVYTAFYDADGAFPAFNDLDVRTSRLQGAFAATPSGVRCCATPGAFDAFDVTEHDAVLVSSTGFAHHVQHPRTLMDRHTPPRFLYAPHTYASGRARPLATLATAPSRRCAEPTAVRPVRRPATRRTPS